MEPFEILVWTRKRIYVVKRGLRTWTVRSDARRKVGDLEGFLAGDGWRASFDGELADVGALAAFIVGRAAMEGTDPTAKLFEAGFEGDVQVRRNAPKPPKMKDVLSSWLGEEVEKDPAQEKDVLSEWLSEGARVGEAHR